MSDGGAEVHQTTPHPGSHEFAKPFFQDIPTISVQSGATWAEIDRTAKLWTIPAARMKAGQTHRVPLTDRALQILDAVEKLRTSDYVFPGPSKGKPFSNMAMATLLKNRMKREAFTVHGFRFSFRGWAGEATAFPCELAKDALAHIVGNEVERAYRRGDALEKRRKLLEAWAKHAGTKPAANVAPMVQPAR